MRNFFAISSDSLYLQSYFAGVVELVDTLDLGSSAARCESSSLSARTISEEVLFWPNFG